MTITDLFIQPAFAESGVSTPSLGGLIPIVVLFIVFWFFLIRPQQKKNKDHKKLINELAVGNEVSTFAGIIGKITEVQEIYVRLIVTNEVELQIEKASIAKVLPKGSFSPKSAMTAKKTTANAKNRKTTAKTTKG